jgi:aryl-alcohol dehydrogenase-like predicted oxidoreductase/predicted kinase
VKHVSASRWPSPSELRVGLGCMRLSTDDDRGEERALATIAAAAAAGITVFDTARSYGHGAAELGHNERLLARALRACGSERAARIVTKGGMTRAGGGWVPDGRAKAIRVDCEASLASLDGLPIDLYLLHAPDPRVPWRTQVRALARLVDDGLVARVGVANVNRRQLDEALELAPLAAVQVAVSPFDDRALRGGVIDRCEERELAVLAHSPLGGPRRAGAIARHEALAEVARAHGASAAEVALAWLLDLSPSLLPIPGARRPETARSAARAATLALGEADRALLAGSLRRPRPTTRASPRPGAEVVLVMGIPGAGKSGLAETYAARGYRRLNRDERGGSLGELAAALDDDLSSGVERLVLDNTYLTRASRSHVLDAAARHGAPVRCVWLDTPLADAQVNLVERLLERVGRLPTPDELKQLARREPGLMAPTSQMRSLRELEPPSADEGFAAVERTDFARTPRTERTRSGVFVAAGALDAPGWESVLAGVEPQAPHLVFDWRPEGSPDVAEHVARLSSIVTGPVEGAVCPHGAGPPVCWCRPPLPGLPLAFAATHGVDPARSTLVGSTTAHRTLAANIGARFLQV